jgi:Spy/CpxP family protein refolding chaperone
MNRKLVLLCVCAMALAFAGLQAVAQDKPDQPSQPASPGTGANPAASVSDADVASKVDARLQQLTTELGLSDDQQKQIKPILVSASKRLQAVKNDPQRSIDDKNSKMDEIHDNARGQIRQFLTPDQSKKLDAMKADDVI